MEMYRIMIVEDDQIIASALKNHLGKWAFEVMCVTDFKDVVGQFKEFSPDLVLLDIMLPYNNGFYWCSEIRRISSVPVIFISSASDNMNVVMAMNMGGDDFICKPFDLAVVTAKIQAVLRRTYSYHGQMNVMEYAGIVLNLGDASLTYQGQRIELTKNEFRIMQELMENAGRTVSRERIMERLWQSDSFIDDYTLTVNMTRLRKKLDDIGLGGLIKTRKGMGYIIE